ncbi:MAG: hypothetical protein HYZ20_06455 [Burkholderiales bacterium]|nr:hypothetical protein [Burkholderiales bacterium]
MKSLVALLLALAASAASAATWPAGPDGAPMSFQQALARAADGDTIELAPGTYKGQVGVVAQRRLTIRGVGERPVFDADGAHAEGKAIWVVRDGDITIENVEFRGARVPDGNGAALRFEKGRLLLRRCRLVDNQNGLLTGNDSAAELVIQDSEFARAPQVEGSLPHLLYAGRIGRLEVTGSRFHQGFEGHLIKSRARTTHLAYNLIVDGEGGGASYEIDLANGGDALIVGNIVAQSRQTQNPVVIAYGAEGRVWERNRLLLSHNTLVSDFPLAWFLRAWPDKLGAGTTIRAVNNLTVGAGLFALGASGDFDGNRWSFASALEGPGALAFELARDSRLRGSAEDPRTLAGDESLPTAEFSLPIGTRPLASPAAWSPGALQR